MLEEQGAPPGAADSVRPPPVRSPRWKMWLRPVLLGLAVAIANVVVFLLLPPSLVERLGGFGYLGAFASAAFANATVLVPVPYYPLLIRLAQAADPWGIVVAAAAGSAIGELVAYYVGRSGRQAMETTRFYSWVRRQLSAPWRAPFVLFALSAPPSPVFDVAGLLAGALGIPVSVFLASTFLGRLVRMAIVVFLGLGLL
jgi:membrane protein YqaA with SNARE-associated domain